MHAKNYSNTEIWLILAKNYNNSLHWSGKGWACENQFIGINNYRYKHVWNSVLKEFSHKKSQKATNIIPMLVFVVEIVTWSKI